MNNDKACMIVSDSFAQCIVPRVHGMCQVVSIFIFCSNKDRNDDKWVKEWPKIVGAFSEISAITEALKQIANQCEQNATSISFMATDSNTSNINLHRLDCSFMYTKILKEIFLTIEFEDKHIQEFIQYCCEAYAGNDRKLSDIENFGRKYHYEKPIWWYTCESCLYPMLNRTLRLMDVDMIIKMGFFIKDLHRHIEEVHKEQFGDQHSSEKFVVYRGQGMSKIDFEQMIQTKCGLIAFNNFLSTSKDRDVSLMYAESNQSNPDLVGILFVILIDPSESTTPFASITNLSYYEDKENEVLFSMHAIFRIHEIVPMVENPRIFQVHLTLTSDDDKDLCLLTERIREENFPDTEGWCRLGDLLRVLGQYEKARQVFELLLEQTTSEDEKALFYHQLGWAKYNQGEYEEAITHYEKSLKIKQKTLPLNHPSLATSYNNMGLVYYGMGEYSKALSSHEEALTIRQQSLSPIHSDLASSYNNLALVHYIMNEYSKALSFHEKALTIRQQSLPSNHPALSDSYNNIGAVCYNMGDYSKALSYYEKALTIRQQSLPSNHPDLGMSYNNIGEVYNQMGDYSKALLYYEKDFEISQKLLPPSHPDLAGFHNNVGVVYDNTGEYSKALSSYEKALAIQQQSLPSNHPDLACTYIHIGIVYRKMGEYPKALVYSEKAMEIQKQSLSPNHPDLAASYNNIGLVYEKMTEYAKAISFCEHAVDIGQQSLPTTHPNLIKWRNHLEDVKKNF